MRELGILIDTVEDHSMGWWVTAAKNGRRFRVVWDARDARLYLQDPSPERAAEGWDPWEDRWHTDLGAGDALDDLRRILGAIEAP